MGGGSALQQGRPSRRSPEPGAAGFHAGGAERRVHVYRGHADAQEAERRHRAWRGVAPGRYARGAVRRGAGRVQRSDLPVHRRVPRVRRYGAGLRTAAGHVAHELRRSPRRTVSPGGSRGRHGAVAGPRLRADRAGLRVQAGRGLRLRRRAVRVDRLAARHGRGVRDLRQRGHRPGAAPRRPAARRFPADGTDDPGGSATAGPAQAALAVSGLGRADVALGDARVWHDGGSGCGLRG